MIVLTIIGLIVCIFGIAICWHYLTEENNSKNKYAFGLCFSSSMGLSCMLCLILIYGTDQIPNAIDVYRGKTELKITKEIVNDSIVKCDSIVVFKDNVK